MLLTARLILRPLLPSDAVQMLALRTANRDFLAPWEPAGDESRFTLVYVEHVIAEQQQLWADDRGYSFGIFDRGSHALLGRVTLSRITRGPFQSCGLGYWLDEGHNGRGLMTEAVRAVVGYAFEALKFHRVEAATLLHNMASMRVLEKAGFRHEGLALRYLQIDGRWQDDYLFAVTVEEWLVGKDQRRRTSDR